MLEYARAEMDASVGRILWLCGGAQDYALAFTGP